MASNKKAWTDEDEAELIKLYTVDGLKDPEILCKRFADSDKNYRSIISKLVQLQIYVKPVIEKRIKPLRVKAVIAQIEKILDIELDGANISNKNNVILILDGLKVFASKNNIDIPNLEEYYK